MSRLVHSHPTSVRKGAAGPSAAPSGSPRKRRPAKSLRRAALLAVVCAAILLLAGLVRFAEVASTTIPPVDPRADAIVVLTGDSERIERALRLLASGHASRLLISGVNSRLFDANGALIGIGLSKHIRRAHMDEVQAGCWRTR